MNHTAHIGPVDAHPKRHRRTHHIEALVLECTLHTLSSRRVHACVVVPRIQATFSQRLGVPFGFGSAAAIHNRTLSTVAVQRRGNSIGRAILGQDPVYQIGSIKMPHQLDRVHQPELANDVVANLGGCGGGERMHRHAREVFAQTGQLPVLGPEVMAPIADAVGFVDGDRTNSHGPHHFDPARIHHPLGGAEEQRPTAIANAIKDFVVGLVGQPRVHGRRFYPYRAERSNLIFHQGDQG